MRSRGFTTIACLSAVVTIYISARALMRQPTVPAIMDAVVLTGQAAPGENGAVFAGLGRPAINNQRTIAFRGELEAIDASYDSLTGKIVPSGIYVYSTKSAQKVIGYGDNAPDVSLCFTNFGDPSLNDKGDLCFVANIGTGYDNQGIFLKTATALHPIALTGKAAPGTGGAVFEHFGTSGVVLNNAGVVVFGATFGGQRSGDGIFLYNRNVLEPVVLSGKPVPGNPDEVFYRQLGVAMNDAGQIAFAAITADTHGRTRTGVFTVTGNSMSIVAIEGWQVNGHSLGIISKPSISEKGDVAFLESTIQRGRVNMLISAGIYIAPESSPLVAVANAEVPQDSAGHAVLSRNFQSPRILSTAKGSEATMFFARSRQSGRHTLWQFKENQLHKIVSEGDAAVIGGEYSFIGHLAVASTGAFAFVSNLKNSSAKAGIFASDINF